MYVENGEETLIRYKHHGQELIMSIDDETYAHFMNDPDIEIIEDIKRHVRPPIDLPDRRESVQ